MGPSARKRVWMKSDLRHPNDAKLKVLIGRWTQIRNGISKIRIHLFTARLKCLQAAGKLTEAGWVQSGSFAVTRRMFRRTTYASVLKKPSKGNGSSRTGSDPVQASLKEEVTFLKPPQAIRFSISASGNRKGTSNLGGKGGGLNAFPFRDSEPY